MERGEKVVITPSIEMLQNQLDHIDKWLYRLDEEIVNLKRNPKRRISLESIQEILKLNDDYELKCAAKILEYVLNNI